MAETTQDEREPKGTEDQREPEGTEGERAPEGAADRRESESTDDQREPDEREDQREPEATEDQREPEDDQEPEAREDEPEGREDEPKSEPVELPEPEEKSADDLLGQQVVDSHGYTIGKIDALFIHGQEERASWALVKTGLVRTSSVFVPLHDAQVDGDQIRVVYEKEHVKAAPEVEPEGNELSDEHADVLHSHYGLGRVKGLTAEADEEEIELPRETRDADPPTMKERPWAIEKYPLPDMERHEEDETSGPESAREEGSDEEPSGEESEDDE